VERKNNKIKRKCRQMIGVLYGERGTAFPESIGWDFFFFFLGSLVQRYTPKLKIKQWVIYYHRF
jgi:hypothetical protein